MGEVAVVVFLLGGWTLAPRRKFEKKDCKFERKWIMMISLAFRGTSELSNDRLRSTHVNLSIGIGI